jgi:hypothetical protein
MLASPADGRGTGMRGVLIGSEDLLLLLAAVLSSAWGVMVVL